METCRKSSLIQISPLPQPKPGREITLPQELVKHTSEPQIYVLMETIAIFTYLEPR